jgi:membrane protease YdiL (CAAX protease family)
LNTIPSFVKHHPLVAYFILVYALAWMLIPLVVSVSLAFALIALFAPAIAAVVVTALVEGRTGVNALLRRVVQWRVRFKWYVVAVGLPVALALAVLGIHGLLGAPISIAPSEIGLTLTLAALVIGEEIGWRGFALPRLQARYNNLTASLILGVLWAAWHLPNALIPGLGHYFYAFPAFLVWVVSMSVLFTWLATHTQGSVLIAWIFHASINATLAIFFIGDTVRQWWLSAAVYAVAALTIVIINGPNLAHKPTAPLESAPANVGTQVKA